VILSEQASKAAKPSVTPRRDFERLKTPIALPNS